MNKTKKLHEWLPYDYKSANVDKCISIHLNDNVICDFDGRDMRWPGTHRNVMNWCVIDTGYAVGWNENPAVGWSFLIKKLSASDAEKLFVIKHNTGDVE